jgi:hypothetical protein
MPDRDDIRWFKTTFGTRLAAALAGTPFTVDFLTAIACQETGEIWPVLRRKGLDEATVLALCVGDTLDDDRGRSAFPKNRAALLAAPDGAAMFAIGHAGLVAMAQHIVAYRGAAARAHKFCRGYGLFQRDLQFFRDDPQYFLQRRYEQFPDTLGHCLAELQRGLRKLGWQNRPTLSDLEMVAVGIAYNTGRYVASKGLKQGHFNGTRYYGEALFDYLRMAQSVAVAGAPAVLPEPSPGTAPVPAPEPLVATGKVFRVDTRESTLRLRSEPKISRPTTRNVIAELPDGHPVRALASSPVGDFRHVETRLGGARFEGHAASRYLVADPSIAALDDGAAPLTAPLVPVVPAVTMPRSAGSVTKRTQAATAHSLNEPGQPGRRGATPAELRAELAAIVDWLAVDRASHRRYQPHDGLTFCNIYSHDYCALAGVYLPRVWWTAPAIAAMARGDQVRPLIGATIVELRANDLFRWLRDFGGGHGWRQANDATTLQQEVNQGAVGLIVARRKQDGRSGHIVPVVPEAGDLRARRDTAGAVIAPLQSQAGATNFRYGTSTQGWWRDEKFADSAFWLHA